MYFLIMPPFIQEAIYWAPTMFLGLCVSRDTTLNKKPAAFIRKKKNDKDIFQSFKIQKQWLLNN